MFVYNAGNMHSITLHMHKHAHCTLKCTSIKPFETLWTSAVFVKPWTDDQSWNFETLLQRI